MGNCLVYRVEEEEYEEEPNVIKNKLYTIRERQVKFVDEYEKNILQTHIMITYTKNN